MKINVINFLLIFALKEKLKSYLFAFFIIILTILFINLISENAVPKTMRVILFILSIFAFARSLGSSSLVPDTIKIEKKGSIPKYSANYFLSVIRYPKELIVTLNLEMIIDSSFIAGFIFTSFYHHLPKGDLLLLFLLFLLSVYFVLMTHRLMNFTNAFSRYFRRVKNDRSIFSAKYLMMFLMFCSLVYFNYRYQLLTSYMLINILRPFSLLIIFFMYYTPYKMLATDYNKEENRRIFYNYLKFTVMLVLLGYVWFYFEEVRSGHIIFDQIKTDNIEKVSATIQSKKDIWRVKNIDYENSPLHYAAQKNRDEIVRLMINKGAPINELNKDGETILFTSTSWCNLDLVEFLIKKGSEINRINSEGNNVLFVASKWNCLPLIKYFEKIGVKKIKNAKGQSHISYARAENKKFGKMFDFYKRNGIEDFLE